MTTAALAHYLLTHVGPFTFSQLRAHASRAGLDAAIRRGEIVRLLPNRYASALHADSWHARSLAAADWAHGAIAGDAALAFADLGDAPARVDVVVPTGRHKRGPSWVRVHATQDVAATWRAFGRRVVVPPIAVVQAYSWAANHDRAERVFAACRRGAKPDQIVEAAQATSNVAQRRYLMRLLRAASEGAESYLEMKADRVLRGPVLSQCLRQHWVRVGDRRFKLDAFHEASATALEFDGEGYHSGIAQVAADRERDSILASVGILTLRFGYARVLDDAEGCRALAEATIRSRRHERPAGSATSQ
ncbi:hypothetical protein [Demequina salsinemoris]|uniref:hypothetical protein n=1 Tax=Demequina salsinemoris TaxID=577470 RepID=UPI000B151AF0|nr:hypothetical protein [Demequina salsinemoris]